MKPQVTLAHLSTPRVALALFASVCLQAQTAQTSPNPPNSETVVLSPFIVRAEEDSGFAASSSLAGGRLATDVRDTPVAYSVITREFIDAMALTDLQAVSTWSTGGAEALDNGAGAFSGVTQQYTIRSSGNTTPQRNFFPINNINDTYAIERVDFGRGPNSILFGNGSLGGIATTTTKRAQTSRSFQTVQTSAGSWDTYRATLDVNRALSDRLAIRVAGVWGDQRSWRMEEFKKIVSAFGTATIKPFKGTEIRVDVEKGQDSRQQAPFTLQDQLLGWDGKTVFAAPKAAATLPSNANALGVGRRGANYWVYDPSNPVASVMNYQNDPTTLGAGATNTTRAGSFVQGTLPSFATSFANLYYAINVPADRFDVVEANSNFRRPAESFTIAPSGPTLTERFHDMQVTVNQSFRNFFFELAADTNQNRQFIYAETARGTNNTYLDINQVRPDGSANPNFLQPYGDSTFGRHYIDYEYGNVRIAAAHVRDTRFGRLVVNVMGGINDLRESRTARYLSLAQGTDHRQWGFLSSPATQVVRIRRYWNATDRSIPDPSLAPIQYVDPVAGVTKQVQTLWAVDTTRRINESINDSTYRYALTSMQAKFFKDRLVLLGAVRYDSYDFYSKQQMNAGDYPLDWNGTTVYYRPDAPADFNSLTYRERDANGTPFGPVRDAGIRPRDATFNPDPRYASDKFKDDFNSPTVKGSNVSRSVGAVYHLNRFVNPAINFAETFNPPLSVVRIDGSRLSPTIATGLDASWRMELLENRLNLNFTYFRSKEINGSIGAGPTDFNNLFSASPVGTTVSRSGNIRGVGLLPSDYRDSHTRTGSGYELEVVANLTKGLRISGSISLPKIDQSDMWPDVKNYIDTNLTLFKQIAADTGVLVDANNVASIDLSIPVNQRSPDAANATTAFNNIIVFRKNIIDGKRIAQDQPVLNAYGDYTIQTGKLKSLRLGLGVQYRGPTIIAYRGADTIVNPSDPTRAIDDPDVDATTPVYTPHSYTMVTGTVAYTWRLKNRREVQANLAISNLLNDTGPVWVSGSTVLRPKNNDFASPARETVPYYFSLKQPIGYRFTLTWKL